MCHKMQSIIAITITIPTPRVRQCATAAAPRSRSDRMATFNERLVREVRKHRQLWNQTSKLHKEAVSREAAWTDVASALGATVDECQTRWRTIRDMYLKRKKRLHVKATGQWNILHHEMSFLDDFLRPRTPSQPHLASIKSEPEDEASSGGLASGAPLPEVEYGADMELSLLPDVTPPSPMPLPPVASVTQERSSDPVELFCLSLAPQLKRLTSRERTKAEVWILQILHGLEFGQYDADVDPQAADIAAGNEDA
ncbi:uncharacterized protein LOC144141567 [Haemaphysalis longicornis]